MSSCPPSRSAPRTPSYEIERLIGAGGTGEVYGAKHPVIGKRVAIKVMSRECSASPLAVTRFVDEAKAVTRSATPPSSTSSRSGGSTTGAVTS